jgi:release factor glutamine methyltransferase
MSNSEGPHPPGIARRNAPLDVYPPREDSFLLLPFARVRAGIRLLEICAGSGLASLEAARHRAQVVAADRNPHALRYLQQRARAERLDVQVVRADLARGLGRFERVLANPPYLPTRPEQRDPDRWHNLALDGGPDGCAVTARIVEDLAHHLTTNGSAFLVVSSLQSPDGLAAIAKGWEAVGGFHEVMAERVLEGERLEVWRFAARPNEAAPNGNVRPE